MKKKKSSTPLNHVFEQLELIKLTIPPPLAEPALTRPALHPVPTKRFLNPSELEQFLSTKQGAQAAVGVSNPASTVQ
jgi:hypothetical protein